MVACASCGFDLDDPRGVDLARHAIAAGADDVGRVLRGDEPVRLRRRPATDVWSVLEYACHIRDVLLVQRERVLMVRRGHSDDVRPMGRDERVEHDGYRDQEPADVAIQVEQAARLFVGVLDRLGSDDWNATMPYAYPEPAERSLRWVAMHTAHEVTHHLHDIRAQIGGGRTPVTPDDVEFVVDGLGVALEARLDRDWHVPAGPLDWDCWETLEHLSEGLLSYAMRLVPTRPSFVGGYPFDHHERRAGGPEGVLFVRGDAGNAGLLRSVNACGRLLVSALRTASPSHRADHVWGRSDPEGFAAMGVIETLAHWHDVAGALDLAWEPPAELCARALRRLFPDAPTNTDPAATVLWATGRGELEGRAPVGDDWRWYADVPGEGADARARRSG